MGTSGVIGGIVRVSGVNWLFGAADRGDLFQQRAGPQDLGAERLHPGAQLRVGGCRPATPPGPSVRVRVPRFGHPLHPGGDVRCGSR